MFVNISAYKFIALALIELPALQQALKNQAEMLNLKGTILLSTEGINVFVAGARANIDAYQQYLLSLPQLNDLHFKESLSEILPFSHLLVRIKKEIISMGHVEVRPEVHTAPHISPETLKQWYDEGRDFVMLDARNDYEVAVGTFDEAIDLHIENFRQFPDAVKILAKEIKEKPVVTFCTGGIRCEKAAEFMQQQGFREVYQLEGGILNYFEKVGGAHYHGECFVFDNRLTLNAALETTDSERCYQHRELKTAADLSLTVACSFCQHLRTSRKAMV